VPIVTQRIKATVRLAVFLLVTVPVPAMSQDAPRVFAGVGAGLGVRGSGSTRVCCGAFAHDPGTLRSMWIEGSLGRRVASRANLEATLDWSAEPEYDAAVQGAFAGQPIGGYVATTRMRMVSAAGVMRIRFARDRAAGWDFVGGLGFARQSSDSHLESVTFRPQLEPSRHVTVDVEDTRTRLMALVGVDLVVLVRRISLVAQCRVRRYLGAVGDRTDLELGRTVVRVGLGMRWSF
jgi:hypothetical protein